MKKIIPILMLVFFLANSCKKDSEPSEPKEPEVIDFNPKSGYAGDTIKITGRNFSSIHCYIDLGNNDIKSCDPTNDNLIEFPVPDTHFFYDENRKECKSIKSFIIRVGSFEDSKYIGTFSYLFPIFSSISDTIGLIGDTVTITGSNFYKSSIRFHSSEAATPYSSDYLKVVSATNTQIKCIVPVFTYSAINYFDYVKPIIEINSNGSAILVKDKFSFFEPFEFSPKSGKIGSEVIFVVHSCRIDYIFKFNNIVAHVKWNRQIKMCVREWAVIVPAGLIPGIVKITINDPQGNPVLPSDHSNSFTVLENI